MGTPAVLEAQIRELQVRTCPSIRFRAGSRALFQPRPNKTRRRCLGLKHVTGHNPHTLPSSREARSRPGAGTRCPPPRFRPEPQALIVATLLFLSPVPLSFLPFQEKSRASAAALRTLVVEASSLPGGKIPLCITFSAQPPLEPEHCGPWSRACAARSRTIKVVALTL